MVQSCTPGASLSSNCPSEGVSVTMSDDVEVGEAMEDASIPVTVKSAFDSLKAAGYPRTYVEKLCPTGGTTVFSKPPPAPCSSR